MKRWKIQSSCISQKNTERYPGVYYLGQSGNREGGLLFPTQIIVTDRLSRETHSGLRILRRPADREDILRFLTEARQKSEPGDTANVNAILSASVAANVDLYARIRRESDMLYPALRELMWEDLVKSREEGREEGFEKGVSGLVCVYRDEMGLDDASITDRIARRYHLTNEQAAHYVRAQQTQ
ncbi:MAG: hypothetical protein IJT94_01690 [Oscillibacter sp.]|nr:hypothetical protein [Oscillibacter sp.]